MEERGAQLAINVSIKNIFNLGAKKNAVEAFIFFVALFSIFMVLIIVEATLLGHLLGIDLRAKTTGNDQKLEAYGTMLSVLNGVLLSVLICKIGKKRGLNVYGIWVGPVMILSILFGPIMGAMIAAYMSYVDREKYNLKFKRRNGS